VGRARRHGRPLRARALRRPAAAGLARAGDDRQAAGDPVRRAALEPRRAAARADAHGAAGAAPGGALHLDLRHPRPARGDDARRPSRRHARRPDRAGGLAGDVYSPAAQPLRRRLRGIPTPRRDRARSRWRRGRGRHRRRHLEDRAAWRRGRGRRALHGRRASEPARPAARRGGRRAA
jgi:hypothetical protein